MKLVLALILSLFSLSCFANSKIQTILDKRVKAGYNTGIIVGIIHSKNTEYLFSGKSKASGISPLINPDTIFANKQSAKSTIKQLKAAIKNKPLKWRYNENLRTHWTASYGRHYSAFLGYKTDESNGVIILTNAPNVLYTANLGFYLLNPHVKLFPTYSKININQQLLKKCDGDYKNTSTKHTVHIQSKEQLLDVSLNNRHFEFYPMRSTEFFNTQSPMLLHVFVSKAGEINKLDFIYGNKKSFFLRKK